MNDPPKTTTNLIEELEALRARVAELESETADLKDAEDALRESEEKYRLLVDSSGYPIVVFSADGVLELINPIGAQNLGGVPEDFVGKSMYELFPEKGDFLMERHRRIIESETAMDFEDVFEFPSGKQWFWSKLQPIKTSDGKMRAVQIVSHDITDRKRAEEALRESEERFRQVVANSQGWVWEVDADGLYTYASPMVERMLGYAPEQIVGKKHFYDLFHPEEREELKRAAFEAFAEKQPFREFLNRNVHKNGETVWLLTSGIPIVDEEGNLLGYRGTDADVTERKRAEEQIEASLKEKELLLKEIQHRVKNNLQLISSLFDLESRSTYDERMISLLKESRNRVRSIALIHEGLYEAKDLTSIDFAEYVKSLATHLFHSHGLVKTDIALKVDVDDLRLSVGVAIPCALIVNELVSNSLKHAFPSDSQGEIHIGLSLDDGNFSLSVGDNGVGLPESLDLQDTASLGLRLVRTLAHQLKGTVELDRDAGTTFTITFPRSLGTGGEK